MTARRLLFVALTAGACAGCGGGNGGGTPKPPVTVTLTSTSLLDGLVFQNGTTTLFSNISAGDYASGTGIHLGMRGFVSFDISAIPSNATVLTATLTLVQRHIESDPYGTLGNVLLDQVVYGFVLEGGAYDRSFPDFQAFATLSSDATLGPKTVVVTAPVKVDVSSGRPQSQFRVRFPIEDDLDNVGDQAQFWSIDTALVPADRPTLVITYQP